MATLELSTLTEYLEEEELEAVRHALSEAGTAPLDIDDTAEPILLARDVDDDVFVDFADRVEANDAGADIYLPSDFEDVFEVGEHRFGSAHALLLVLENLREDFFIEDEEEEEESEEPEEGDFEAFDDEDAEGAGSLFGPDEDAAEMKEDQLRHIWKIMNRGARACIQRGLCLVVRS